MHRSIQGTVRINRGWRPKPRGLLESAHYTHKKDNAAEEIVGRSKETYTANWETEH